MGLRRAEPLPAQHLLELVGTPIDPDDPEDVPLDKSPGFTAEQVEGRKKLQRRRRGAGYISDPKKRKAVEEHAEQLATAHYELQGWTVEKLGKPYDLRCTRGTEERHVEVKGTTGAATSVELTINEVLYARDKGNTVDPYVVSDISMDTATDPYGPSGARSGTIPTGSRPRTTSGPASTSTAFPTCLPDQTAVRSRTVS
ncbi:DUF3883 domain-containing protein [Streptomyces barringtoniae]|uniref:DUF3883 domain-containing protein n=1 Tax=Streptomyces barringtoniae TaxID=2892029 RepID=UPI001E293591|nr:DUF3883 domain-containing protein [Streptomyces barringtoniae]MCC5480838.1 DUF3883 domain-containing protein [Streptomyces barringtoniae]